MMSKICIPIGLAVIYMFGVVGLSDAATTGPLTPAPLAQVIEGAKKEGTVAIKLVSAFTPKSMYRLEKEIKDRYGVDLKINLTGATKFTSDLAQAITEQKAGAIPSFDLLSFSNHVAQANKAGVLEVVDWKPLLSEGTNPGVVNDNPLMGGAIVYYTAHLGLMYQPEKVKADEVPRTLRDLANPRWKGKASVPTAGNSWVRWAFILGKDKFLSDLRALMKNGTLQGSYMDQMNRYLIGEIWFSMLSSEHLYATRDKGMPAAWQTLDFGDTNEFALVVRKGASHANAAKLIALYLASPEGAKFELEEAKLGTYYYPGNYEHEIKLQNQKSGIREFYGERETGILEFYDSKEGSQISKEVGLILQSGGER